MTDDCHWSLVICHWLVLYSRQLAQVRLQHRLRAAPDEKEQGLAAPAAGGMPRKIARPLGGCQGGLRGPQREAVRSLTQVVAARDAALGSLADASGWCPASC